MYVIIKIINISTGVKKKNAVDKKFFSGTIISMGTKKVSTTKTRKQRELTLNERNFLSYYLDESNPKTFFNAVQSTFKAYPKVTTYSSAQATSGKVKKKLRPIIEQWLREEGLADEQLKGKLVGLVGAAQEKIITINGRIDDPDTLPPNTRIITVSRQDKMAQGGHYVEEWTTVLAISTTDNSTRCKALDMAFKHKGLYAEEKINANVTLLAPQAIQKENSVKDIEATLIAEGNKLRSGIEIKYLDGCDDDGEEFDDEL